MTMRDPERSFTRREERRLLESAAALLRSDFPQPDRTGCPSKSELKDLASRRRGLADSTALVDHIGSCSPCFEQYSLYRARHKQSMRIAYGAGAMAAGIAIALLAWLPARQHPIPVPTPPAPSIAKRSEAPSQPVRMTLDLSQRGIARSDEPGVSGASPDIVLPCVRLQLSVYLPIGSEDGRYDVAVINAAGGHVLESGGEARLRNYVEILEVELDLADLSPGSYKLGVRRAGFSWRLYPIVLSRKEVP